MPSDLTATAKNNASARQAAASELLDNEPTGQLQRFESLAASSAFSTNVNFDKIAAYDECDSVLDARSYHLHRTGGDAVAGNEAYELAQGRYLVRRERFEGLWMYGRSFLYGAVNAGGLGITDFGPICLVVSDPTCQSPDALGVFPGDTLARYTMPGGDIDATLAVTEVTAWEDRSALAVAERANDVTVAPEADWPLAVCSESIYFEVVRAKDLPLEEVAEVRLTAALRERLEELRARSLVEDKSGGNGLTSVERNEARSYDSLHRWRREYGIEINELPL